VIMDSTKTVYNSPISNLLNEAFKSDETYANKSASNSAKDYPFNNPYKIGKAFFKALIPPSKIAPLNLYAAI